MERPYMVTWWRDMSDDATSVSVSVTTFADAMTMLSHISGYERYRITQGDRFVERGDPIGPRGAPAPERMERA